MTDTTPEEAIVDPTLGTQEPIEDSPLPEGDNAPVAETFTLEADVSTNDATEVIERKGATSVSRQYRQLTGLDTSDE